MPRHSISSWKSPAGPKLSEINPRNGAAFSFTRSSIFTSASGKPSPALLASFIGVVAAVFYYVEWRDKPAATGIAIGENASQSASAPATPDQRTPPGGVVDRVVIAIKRHPRDAKGITFLVGFLLVGYLVGLQDADYIALLIFIGVVAAVFYYVEWREKPSATDTALSESAGQSAAPPAAPDQRTPPGGVVDRVVIAIKRHPRDAKGITFLVGFLLVGYLVGLQDAGRACSDRP